MRTVLVAAILAVTGASAASAQTLKLTERLVFVDGATGGAATGWQVTALKKDRGPHADATSVVMTGAGSASAPRAGREYRLIGAPGLGDLPTVDILAIHYIKVQPGQAAAFEKFVADKLNPAVGKLRPDLRLFYYKSAGGPDYISVFALTRASRDKYWPGGSDSDDLKAAFTPQIKALATELETYLVPDSFGVGMTAAGFEAKDWADWGLVAR